MARWLLGALGIASMSALVACGGSSADIGEGPAHPTIGSSDASTGDYPDAGAWEAGGLDATTDVAVPVDSCVPPEAGVTLTRDPAYNTCGATRCLYSSSYCCVPRSNAAPACADGAYGSNTSACVDAGSLPVACDEKAKCQHSTVCCAKRAAAGAPFDAIGCVEKVSCLDPDLVVCGSDADCSLGRICVSRAVYGTTLGFCEPATCGVD